MRSINITKALNEASGASHIHTLQLYSLIVLPPGQGTPAHCWFCPDSPSSSFGLYHSDICNKVGKVLTASLKQQ